ncbi:hypothetical protein DERP_015421 [Dermatophagoides pteronyssinus]|uniref:Uncharacterized protein n=1 Tax=Dermatophagoides pteronyssinus TaxID=6956 RepID=A0ABQ8J1G2_DERPT|nr:hypothetical protein DERP_015421 [Dermatophagoides pteronyssinus]
MLKYNLHRGRCIFNQKFIKRDSRFIQPTERCVTTFKGKLKSKSVLSNDYVYYDYSLSPFKNYTSTGCGATKQDLQDRQIAGHSLHIHTSNNADALLNPEKFGIGKETIFTILSCNLFKLAPLDLFHDILLPISSG